VSHPRACSYFTSFLRTRLRRREDVCRQVRRFSRIQSVGLAEQELEFKLGIPRQGRHDVGIGDRPLVTVLYRDGQLAASVFPAGQVRPCFPHGDIDGRRRPAGWRGESAPGHPGRVMREGREPDHIHGRPNCGRSWTSAQAGADTAEQAAGVRTDPVAHVAVRYGRSRRIQLARPIKGSKK
jgi:hypothetical protein